MVKIGVIGLGKMGCAIARRMRFKGINVSGWTCARRHKYLLLWAALMA